MYATHAEHKEETHMITKEFLEKHFRHHDKLVVYQGRTPLTITKAWHLRFEGGHHAFDVADCADLEELLSQRAVTLDPVQTEQY